MLHKEEKFEGNLQIDIDLHKTSIFENQEDMFLDFHGLVVKKLNINGKDSTIRFEKHKLYLPKGDLSTDGTNKILIQFENTYVTNSAGLHRF